MLDSQRLHPRPHTRRLHRHRVQLQLRSCRGRGSLTLFKEHSLPLGRAQLKFGRHTSHAARRSLLPDLNQQKVIRSAARFSFLPPFFFYRQKGRFSTTKDSGNYAKDNVLFFFLISPTFYHSLSNLILNLATNLPSLREWSQIGSWKKSEEPYTANAVRASARGGCQASTSE